MIITCPYCGPRDSSEFAYQGDGDRTRPDPASTDQAAWNAYVYDRVNTAGEHRRDLAAFRRLPRASLVVRNTLTHKISSVGFARDHGSAARAAQGGDAGMSPRRATSGGLIDRSRTVRFSFDGQPISPAIPATRWPRRCSPTASRCSAARSSTIARAACSPPASTSPTRW